MSSTPAFPWAPNTAEAVARWAPPPHGQDTISRWSGRDLLPHRGDNLLVEAAHVLGRSTLQELTLGREVLAKAQARAGQVHGLHAVEHFTDLAHRTGSCSPAVTDDADGQTVPLRVQRIDRVLQHGRVSSVVLRHGED